MLLQAQPSIVWLRRAKNLQKFGTGIPGSCCSAIKLLSPLLKWQVLEDINALENAKAQQLGVMVLAASQRLDQLWTKCTPAQVLGWMSKLQVGCENGYDDGSCMHEFSD